MSSRVIGDGMLNDSRSTFGLLGQALGIGQRLPEEELDLPVQAAQVVVGPALERLQQPGVHPQEEWLPLGHDYR